MLAKSVSWHRNVFLAITSVIFMTSAIADPTDLGENDIPTSTIEFAEDSSLGGKSARFDRTISSKGQRLVVKGLDVMRPLVVQVFTKNIAKPVDVSLHRYFWGKASASGSTGSRGDWAFRGRAHDEIGITLSVNDNTPVYALVWQGPAVPALVPAVVVDADRASDTSGGYNVLTIGIVGLLSVIVVLLATLVLRKPARSAPMIIMATLLSLSPAENSAWAQADGDKPPNPFADDQKPPGDDYKPEEFPDKPEDESPTDDNKLKPDPDSDKPTDEGEGNKLEPDPDSDKPTDEGEGNKLKPDPDSDKPTDEGEGNKLKPDPDSDKPTGEGEGNKLKPNPDSGKPPEDGDGNKLKPDPESDKPKPETADGGESTRTAESTMDGGESAGSNADADGRGDASFDDRLEAAYGEIRQLRGEIAANAGRISSLEFLIQQDRETVPAPGDGAPPISVSCENDAACQACLANSNEKLSGLLINLDKLRIIYVNYVRYHEYMVGLGDAMSGFHQLEQAAWYRVKLEIADAKIGLEGAYDSKFDEYKGRLSQALQELSACDSDDGDTTFTRESVLFENYVKAKYSRQN